MTARPLRLIIIEDVEDHAMLMVRELQKGGFNVAFERVETREDLATALEAGEWDAVISDYNLPGFNGLQALRMVKEKGDIPFVLVSGAIGEELAAEVMKAGAHDYIKKENLGRLTPTLERELKDAAVRRERRQAADELARNRENLEELVRLRTSLLENAVAALKESEEKFRLSEERHRLALKASKDAAWDWDTLRNRVLWSEAVAESFGYDEALQGTTLEWWKERIHPDDADRVIEDLNRAIDGTGDAWNHEYRFLRSDGSWAHVLDRGFILRDKEGRPYRMVGSMLDMTERLTAEEALKRSESLFRELAEALPNMVWLTRADGHSEYFNNRWYQFAGWPRQKELGGDQWTEILHPDDLSPTFDRWNFSMRTGQTYQIEYRLRAADGVYRWFLARAVPLRDGEGNVTRWIGTCTDIEDQKAAREAAEAATRAKSEFMANMSHEIRTPMNGILGMTDLLLETETTPLQRQYLEMVKSSGEALLSVVNDILDFSKLEAGATTLETIEFDIRELVEKTADTISFKAFQKGLEFVIAIEPTLPGGFRGDPAKLRQVLLNLVSNAIKFTDAGEVVVKVTGTPADHDTCLVTFSVADTGIGIPEDKLGMLFQSFTQLDASTARSYGGTGLGLAISRRIVHAMGGRIWAESRHGAGSTFSFQVPLPKTDQPAMPEAPQFTSLAGLKALVIDDNETNRLVLHQALTTRGILVDEAATGQDAVDKVFAAADAGVPFDLVLIDLRLPDCDGYQIAERLRERFPLEKLALMMVTSDDITGGATRARGLGMSAYLVKPVRIRSLMDALLHIKGLKIEVDAETSPVEPEPAPSLPFCVRVLVAEDNPVNMTVVEAMLSNAGASVTGAVNGAEAVRALDRGGFDVVLMDVQMPEVDGFEATRRIREAGRDIPIIGLTAHALEGDRERCLEGGMDDYLPKPFLPQDLIAKVSWWTKQRPQQPAGLERLLRQVGGNRAIVDTVVDTFKENVMPQLAEVRRAADGADPAAIRQAAHRLKGAVSAIGADRARCLAERLEKTVQDNDLSKAGVVVEQLEAEIARILKTL